VTTSGPQRRRTTSGSGLSHDDGPPTTPRAGRPHRRNGFEVADRLIENRAVGLVAVGLVAVGLIAVVEQDDAPAAA